MKNFLLDILRFLQRLIFGPTVAVRLKMLDENKKEITMGLTIAADKKRTLSIAPVDAKGRPAKIDGVPVWDVTPTGGVSLFPSTDGLSCDIVWLDARQQVVSVQADADLGAGVKTITGSLDVETLSAEAVGFTINAGPEVDQ